MTEADRVMTQDSARAPGRLEWGALLCLCAATPLLVTLERFAPGLLVWAAGALLTARSRPGFRLKLGTLYGVVLLLALAPIDTDRSTGHFLHLGAYFAAVVFIPTLIMRRKPGVIEWRFWPRRFQWLDVFYVAISIPLAWAVIRGYFFVLSPEVPANWPMPQPFTEEGKWRLFVGINAVGIWDELFFVNTVYGLMRACFPAGRANLAQAVVYTSVLTDMAFTGVGPIVVYIFALTQGAMYERSRCLLYVLIVHLIVDAFLVAAILQYHYPGRAVGLF